MQSVAWRTKGSSAVFFWRIDICIHALESMAAGIRMSRETFNTSDNPNKGSRIIRCAPRIKVWLWRYPSRSSDARKICIILPNPKGRTRPNGTDRLRRDCVDMPKRSNAVALMTAEQAALLRKIAFDAYEPEAFSPNLTKAEAERRIAALQAKLKLMGEPPHIQ